MKKKRIKIAVKLIAFIVVLSVIYSSVSYAFQPKALDPTGEIISMQQYYDLPKHKVELLFLGNSQISCGIDSVSLYQNNGILSFAQGGGSNPLLVNYYFLLDVLKQQNIKAVAVDVSAIYNSDNEFDAAYRKNLDGMRLSVNKLAAIRDYIKYIPTPENEKAKPHETYITYLLNLLNYHSRWNELDKIDFDREMLDGIHFNGFYATETYWEPAVKYQTFILNDKQKPHDDWIREEQVQYLVKIIQKCQAENIELLLIKTPKRSWTKPAHEYAQRIADENGVTFIDFNEDENLKAIDYDYYQDMRDKDHLNTRGAQKLTAYLGDYFTQRLSFTDYRDSGVLSQEFLDAYERRIKRCYLNSSNSAQRYLTELSGKDYTVTFQSDGNLSTKAFREIQEELYALGLTVKLSDLKKKNYMAVINNGAVEYEEASKDELYYKLSLMSKNDVKLYCSQEENTTRVYGTKYNFAQGGLRICVFENATGEFISRVSIYEDNGKLILRRKVIYENE